MCGIAGFISRRSRDGALRQMTRRIAHRGPDGEGAWATCSPAGWHVALGHRRLAIIDLATGGQPLGNEDGLFQITFNGEIYNFAALRDRSIAAGHRFVTKGDTEAIVHHLDEHGEAGLRDLHGMFAFALWDARAGRLTLARDRAGIKPLFYAPLPDGGVAFASELTALLALDDVGRSLDPRGLASFFYRDCVDTPHSILAGVRKLPPGHVVTWQDGKLDASRAFWSLADVAPRDGPLDDGALIDEGRARLDAAVASQLMADVPIGVFLSGGLDSSLGAALARRHHAGELTTFSIGFDDPDYDESAHARAVAAHLGTRHVERRFGEADLIATIDDALATLDEPMADPSLLPTFMLSRLAAEHVKVALGGDGGDELWAGYPTYRAHRAGDAYRAIPHFIRKRAINAIIARLPVRHGYQPLEWKLKRFALRFRDDAAERHQEWMSAATSADVFDATGQPTPWLDGLVGLDRDAVGRALAIDFQSYLSGSVLTKVDRASMACGLEVRPPLLDESLIDFAFGLPTRFKLRGRTSKWMLKEIAGTLLPASIVHRKKKGFGVPLARWIATTLDAHVAGVLRDSALWATGELNRDAFVRWRAEHAAKRVDHSRSLWALIVLDAWHRRAIG